MLIGSGSRSFLCLGLSGARSSDLCGIRSRKWLRSAVTRSCCSSESSNRCPAAASGFLGRGLSDSSISDCRTWLGLWSRIRPVSKSRLGILCSIRSECFWSRVFFLKCPFVPRLWCPGWPGGSSLSCWSRACLLNFCFCPSYKFGQKLGQKFRGLRIGKIVYMSC